MNRPAWNRTKEWKSSGLGQEEGPRRRVAVATRTRVSPCGGGGFDDSERRRREGGSANGPVELKMLIASSGRRRDQRRQGRRRRLGRGVGQHGQRHRRQRHEPAARAGVRQRQPAGRLLHRRRPVRRTTPQAAASTPTPTRSRTTTTSTSRCARPSPTRASSTARRRTSPPSPSRSTPTRGRRPGSPTPTSPTTWDELEAVAEEAHHRRPGGSRASASASTGSAPSSSRTAAGGSTTTRPRRPPTPRGDRGPGVRAEERQGRQLPDVQTSSTPGWGGEAFGTKKSAMTIEGNWIKGAINNDYPDLKYTVVELPAGPEGQGDAGVHPVLGHRRRLQGPGPRPSTSSTP